MTGQAGTPFPARLVAVALGAGGFAALAAIDVGLPQAAWHTACVAPLMAFWWVTQAIPLPATGLLPLVLFPVLGVASFADAAAPFASQVIFLFLGGFLLGAAMEGSGLHRHIALGVIAAVGDRAGLVVGAFMAVTAALSMWISNTATAAMMVPIALSVTVAGGPEAVARARPALLLGIAYAASIGGMGTIVGSPPNAILVGYLAERRGATIGFGEWMAFGVPLVALFLPTAWLILTRILFRLPRELRIGTGGAVTAPGPLSGAEKAVAAVLAVVVLAWIARPFAAGLWPKLGITDAGIALAGALAMFLVPADRTTGQPALDWEAAKAIPWGILLLFGGGLSLAQTMGTSGLTYWIRDGLGDVAGWPAIALIAATVTLVVFLTELTSNTATVAIFLPIAAALAAPGGTAQISLLLPLTLAASCAFMMPVATPPNAIVFGSGHLTVPQMMRAGFLLNLASIVMLTAFARLLVALARIDAY